MTAHNATWKKSHTEVIDQRQVPLPPCWVATKRDVAPLSERGDAIHESGAQRVVANAVIGLLQQAKKKVVVSSFLLADPGIEDELFATSQRGVHVYVLLASETRLGKEVGDSEFDQKVFSTHTQMLARLGGHVLFRSASNFHAKAVVVDPETNPAGLLLTANLTTDALKRNEELAVVLTAQEVVETTAYLKWAMWEAAEHELADPKHRFRSVKALGKVQHPAPSSSVIATTANTTSIRDEALRLINSARSRIILSSYGWSDEHEVVHRLAERAREGIDVTVLSRVRPASMPSLVKLAEAGAKVVGFKWLHAKAIWVDTGEAMVMSANLEAHGLDDGFELGVRLTGARAAELLGRLTRWNEMAPWRLTSSQPMGDVSGEVKLWHRGELVEGNVRASVDVDLGTVTSTSAHPLEATRPAVQSEGQLPKLAHEVRCTWTVAPPVLASKAKELRKHVGGAQPVSYAPPVFREPNERIVVAVRSHDELEPARALMTEVGATAIVLVEGASQ